MWRYGGEGIEKWVLRVCNKIWSGEEWPKKWNEGW